ncbi:DUF4011 domain-containing protein [Celerinatantimonas sp. MCCC 1A17872]|uniref:DUF4011 domain-containing protein n=1 Tax=Celerinatantimonas sp. MCCC 1A17872 TaxID=3177514 RepID=UPI0038C867CE
MIDIVSVQIYSISTFSLAAQQNSYPLIKNIKVEYSGNVDDSASPDQVLKSLKLKLEEIPGWLAEYEWLIDELRPRQRIDLVMADFKLPFEKLFGLTEELSIQLTFNLYNDLDEVISSVVKNVDILPANYWGGENRQPDLLAAFVKPNGIYVESLLRQVANSLEKHSHSRSLDGYQNNTREKPYLMVATLWNVLFEQKLAYVSPPPSFAKYGQRIRLANEISSSKIAACLDTSLLFASCIEAMGLNAIIALTKEHAFAGAWLINERLPVLTNDDPMDVRKRVDNRDIVFFETTMITNSNPVTFAQSAEYARSLISEENEDDFVYVIDIAQARARQIKPLSTVEEARREVSAESTEGLPEPVIPPLPPVRFDERVEQETPETRIDTWSRKLLDLSKRNSLLNFSDRAISIRIFCPNIASLEDMLADGQKFQFISAQDSPLNDRNRDLDGFRMQNGRDLHRAYALDQLENQVLIANQSTKRMDSSAVSLYRKAKNDLEEGGSNTLYLALGMLKWKENPEDDRSYRAPLILLPITLSRKSARSPVYLEQLADEEPIFNLTLIEFLQVEQNINLAEFKDDLPKDDSGIDVAGIWRRVRDEISEHRGFEVSEELVLASFSFSKYLMWKDLRDRIGDLKENLFVEHLVDNPREPYPQKSNFIERYDIDHKVDFSKIFTPLNCDSSQLVAVEASAHSQDFVLEGPPGTGKSETIANIIAHNIGMGRTVLFVAEKMAALNVVYRRMQKVGLQHLCLEIHSNKTNKRMVLDQLEKAWTKRNGLSQQTWEMNLSELGQKRTQLNTYVEALHAHTIYGLSVRDTIATLAKHSDELAFELDWPLALNACPFKNENDLKDAQTRAKNLAIAFEDLSGIEPISFEIIKTINWSNVWQTQTARLFEQLIDKSEPVQSNAISFAGQFDLALDNVSLSELQKLSSLGDLIRIAIQNPIGYAIEKGAKERLSALKKVSEQKAVLDTTISKLGQPISVDKLKNVPINDWIELAEQANTGWFKSIISKWKLKASCKKIGIEPLSNLDLVDVFKEAVALIAEIEQTLPSLNDYKLWSGWDTTSAELEKLYYTGVQASQLQSNVLSLSDDPVSVLIQIKKWFVDGRDYLEDSKVYIQWCHTDEALNEYNGLINQLEQSGVTVSNTDTLQEVVRKSNHILSNRTKLKYWCEWQSAKETAQAIGLQSLVNAIEAGLVSPKDASHQFYVAYCKWLAPLLIDQNPALRKFKASSHEETINRFRELDEEVANITSEYIITLASQKIPKQGGANQSAQFGILARELQKKTRHIPIRTLIEQMGESLLELCPCLMMSPLSVAQFLPSDFHGVDLVVFDEASQMTTWDSVGAIARGKNVVIVGDPKQMPPTNFFNAQTANDDADEEDLESILDQALAARLPLKRLMGHYRSKHETLIAFSNSQYYENSLVTYPSSDTKESVVSCRRVNGIYAKGKGRNNPIEAKAVVDEVIRRLNDPILQNLSIGIVTLNTEQQRTIEDLLDDARRQYPEIEKYFHDSDGQDPLFVKNLESVQGDERDIIILSLAYGPTEPEAKTMSMNFGPLNKSGGERRLNVAITRATSEIIVFSSFDSSMIDLSRTSSKAIEDLKHYLEFAERGPIALAEQSFANYGVDQFDSDFEQAVATSLRAKGWKVQTQVGVSKFRIDLGVFHPDQAGRYLAGIECDGATYHSLPTARDRDRVRQNVLENLGWNIIRLWSTDYFIDADAAISKIHNQLQQLLEDDRKQENLDSQLNIEDNVLEFPTSEKKTPEDMMTGTYAKAASIDELTESSLEIGQSQNRPEYNFSASDYFKENHAETINHVAKEILEEKPGITLHTLALDIANLHGLTRTSKKQRDYLMSLVSNWAGIVETPEWEPTLWASSEQISQEVAWRGLNPFGYERTWSEISYQEAMGLVRYALQKAPTDPVGFMCDEFALKRRHETTISQFSKWIEIFKNQSDE